MIVTPESSERVWMRISVDEALELAELLVNGVRAAKRLGHARVISLTGATPRKVPSSSAGHNPSVVRYFIEPEN